MLLAHLHQGLCKGPTDELCLALNKTLGKPTFETGDEDKTRVSEVQFKRRPLGGSIAKEVKYSECVLNILTKDSKI